MKSKLSKKEKAMAYILNKEMGYPQSDIAEFMSKKQPDKKLSQSTIANGIKDASNMLQLNKLQKKYEEAKQTLIDNGLYIERPKLIESSNDVIIDIDFDE